MLRARFAIRLSFYGAVHRPNKTTASLSEEAATVIWPVSLSITALQPLAANLEKNAFAAESELIADDELPVIALHAVPMIEVMEPLGDQGELPLSEFGHPEKGRPDPE